MNSKKYFFASNKLETGLLQLFAQEAIEITLMELSNQFTEIKEKYKRATGSNKKFYLSQIKALQGKVTRLEKLYNEQKQKTQCRIEY